ncbi:MAG: N-acyl-L-amino acid amidohydrolase [Woeseia sp.]|nr:N-acyl-L-amino acid amidohydrolase [Woeseia sp.]
MNPIRLSLAICLTTIFNTAWPQDVKNNLEEAFIKVESKVIEWRHDLHQNPELSNREFKTAAKVAALLRSLNFDEVQTGVAHTGVVGTLVGKNPGPVVALRADMDGLPVMEQTGSPFASKARGEYNGQDVPVMHACGHDTHVAMLMGAAEVLANNRDQLSGTVKFIFQPAEEGPPAGEDGGAAMMIVEGVLDGPNPPEAILGLHAWPNDIGTLTYRSGGFMASADNLQINVIGRQTHGSSPWLGVDPIYVAAQIATAIQGIPSRHLDITNSPAVITIGSIHGGVRGNIIPDEVEMMGTIRTFDVGVREKLHTMLRNTVHAIAEANGATATVTMEGYAPVTGNNPELLKKMMPTLNWAAGAENVVEGNLITGAEDFSFFQERIPGLFLMLGVIDPSIPRSDRPSNHSPMFIADDRALMTGVRTLVGFALDYPTVHGK